MRKKLVPAVAALFALFLSGLVSSLGLDQEAGFFVASGETMALANFSHEGKTYHVLKINGENSVLFQEADGNFSAVTDEALLAVLVPAFLKTQPLPFDESVLEGVRTNYDFVNKEVGVCVHGVEVFYACQTPLICAYKQIQLFSSDYATQLAEVNKMDVAFPNLRQGMSDLSAGFSSLETSFRANDLDGLASASLMIYNGVSAIQASFNVIAAAVSVIRPVFPPAFTFWNATTSTNVDPNCTSSSALSTALSSLSSFASSTKALSTADTLNKIKSVTLARNASAAAKRIHFSKSEAFKPVSRDARKVLADFGSAGLVVTGLNSELTQLTNLLESVRNASTVEDAEAKAKTFDSKSAEFKTKVALYASLAPEYNASVVAKSNASAQISKAAKRYGANSEFVIPLQKQYSATTNSLKTVQEKLAAGQNVSLADLQEITANYTQIISTAVGLKPRESQIDWLIIGGVLAVVLAVLGTVVYFKKFKPPALKLGLKKEKIIDIRQLPAEKPPSTGPPIEGPPWVKRP